MLLVGVWLIVQGLVRLLDLRFPAIYTVLAILGISAGVVLVIERKGLRLSANLGVMFLASWLIASGLLALLQVSFTGRDTILAGLAVAAGLLLVLHR
jgi:hypothetical protein